jgi:hypothetical protein
MAVRDTGRAVIGKKANVRVGVSTFIPKPHTPFQWVPLSPPDEIKEKQALLIKKLRGQGLKLSWTDPQETLLEGWLSRGDRRMAEVVHLAWKNGAKFDAWQDQFKFSAWQDAFSELGMEHDFYTTRTRAEDEVFPWDHISTGVKKDHLLSEYSASQAGELTEDCFTRCSSCGILAAFRDEKQAADSLWRCP